MKYLFFLLLLSTIVLKAQNYLLIAHKDVPKLSENQIKAIFLKKMKSKEGVHFIPVNLGVKDSTRRAFESKYMSMSLQRLKSYWAKQHYLGHRPPHSFKSQKAVIAFITKVAGSIGYIQESALKNSDIQIIFRWSK